MTRDYEHTTGAEFDRYPLPLPRSCPTFSAGTRLCWVLTAREREALHFVNGPASSGTCHVSHKTPDHSQ
ncbi:unnamed protein product, partial [Staurois parvus]